MVYGNFDDDKFIYNEVKKQTVLNPKYLTSIKQFTLIKKLVSSCAESNDLVDIELLRSLIDQANIRLEMMTIEMRIGDLDIGKDRDAILKDIIFELF